MDNNINNIAIKCEEAIASSNLEKITSMIRELQKVFEEISLSLQEQIFYNYFLGNLHSEKSKILEENSFSWRQNIFPTNKVLAINYFRKALNLADNSLANFYDINTNLANELNGFCRTIEAIELWDFDYESTIPDAKYIEPYARFNNLCWLSCYLNDSGHSDYYLLTAYQLIKYLRINADKIEHPGVQHEIINSKKINDFIAYVDIAQNKLKPLSELWSDKNYKSEEKIYRKWCLDNNLFLNDLNDITKTWVAAQDILQFPNYIVKINDGPFYSAAFSDLKSRYCYARHLAFRGFFDIYPNYERKDLYLTDTLDYVEYSGSVENLKVAIRLCFSILDSLASLMNQYFEIKNKKSSFSPSWIQKNFKEIKNPFIDALYWISCDLFDSSKIHHWQAPNPNASDLRILRNDMEHNWVRISEFESVPWDTANDYANTISKDQLKKATLEIFKYVRSSLLYLVFAVKFNEEHKKVKSKFVPSIEIPIY